MELQHLPGPGASPIEENWRRLLKSLRKTIIPALAGKPGAVAKTAAPKKVLIVEDDIDSVRTLSMLVAEMGHTVEYAINGYVAVSLAKRFKPDVVLLDIGLPGLDGFDVCSQIKQDPELQDTRVIVITGYSQPEFLERSRKVGCESHLVKPVAPAVLEKMLR